MPAAAPAQVAPALPDPREVDRLDEHGSTELMAAASNNEHENVTRLLQAGASIDLHNEHGSTALTKAAYENSVDSVELLLRWGAVTPAALWRLLRLQLRLLAAPRPRPPPAFGGR